MIEMTNEMEQRIYEALADRYGANTQIIVAVEELAELQQALCKWLRSIYCADQGPRHELKEHIREEIADASIMLNQMELMFGDTADIQEQKLQRLYGRVADTFDEDGNRKPMHWWGGDDEDDG